MYLLTCVLAQVPVQIFAHLPPCTLSQVLAHWVHAHPIVHLRNCACTCALAQAPAQVLVQVLILVLAHLRT